MTSAQTMLELADAGERHAEGLSAQLALPHWTPGRAHIEQARNSIKTLAALIRSSASAPQAGVREALADLVEINRSDETGNPDLLATDEWRAKAWEKARKAISAVSARPSDAPVVVQVLEGIHDSINALGGSSEQNNSYDQGIVDTVAKVLEIIEKAQGSQPEQRPDVPVNCSWCGAALAALPQAEGVPTYEFPYQQTFDAICAAVHSDKEPPFAVSVSVKKFQEAFNSHRDKRVLNPPRPDAPATDADLPRYTEVRGILPAPPAGGEPVASREAMAKTLQQFWQGSSGRSWDDPGDEKSCCALLPEQADWFRKLADVALAQTATPQAQEPAWREARRAMTEIAAECHRAKWKYDGEKDKRPFDDLHRIGDLALKLRDAALSTPTVEGMREAVIEQCAKVAERSDALAVVRANVAREIRALTSESNGASAGAP